MEPKSAGEKNRHSYFSNVKTRLGSKLPASAPPPGFPPGPWGPPPHSSRAPGTRPPHVPHIRNPQLRQYYLRDSPGLPEVPAVKSGPSESTNGRAEYIVRHDDTVFSVASQFSTTPSQLAHLNRLSSNTLFPGQRLCVPWVKCPPPPSSSSVPDPDPKPDKAPETATAPATAPAPGPLSPSPDSEYDKLLDVEAVSMPDGQLCLLALPAECSEGEGPAAMPYLKLCSRYITDRKGVVSGILLVTPNKIFFDPYKSHPLVVEQGWEEYLLSCPVDGLVSVSFCSDISHVHFNTSAQRSGATPRWKGRRKTPNPRSVRSLVRKVRGPRQGPPADPGPAVLALVSSTTAELSVAPGDGGRAGAERELAAHSAGMLGVAVLSSAATFCCGGLDAGDKVRTELVPQEGQEPRRMGERGTGSSRSSGGSVGSLMFVRLRFHQPPGQKGGVSTPELGGARTQPMKDGSCSDELYAYLSHWRPDLCILEGRDEEDGGGDDEEFVLVDGEEQEEGTGLTHSDSQSGEDWEMISVEDGGGRSPGLERLERDPEGLTDILEQSRILLAHHVREISAELPARTVGHVWQLTYSTSCHGASLKSLYRKLVGLESPVLIVIKDSRSQVFGSFLSHPLRLSETFYGTGETFLFMLHPRIKCFRWTGENSFFIKGDLDSFAIGGGSGHFGLWLDEALYIGRTSPCQTFNNCCLSDTDDFRVMELEAWTFC
ncbi:hypothetical protein COCON_G00001410 [Conger conger]|uniref:Oxidation resistance protein 1 n=1 Tax=Conger conger TaxID=82655 RepID=A0A9Q1E0Q2_CONCO|nr:hypothetical protein COCON_G00001410 [Conger conger]